jgi:hypothetical protein
MSNNKKQDLNTNIDDYTTEDLLGLLNLDENASKFDIERAATISINQFTSTGDKEIVTFLEKARDRLINEFSAAYAYPGDELNNPNKKLGEWYQNEYLPQRERVQQLRITSRKQQVETWDENDHFTMKPNMLGVANAYQVPVAQDVLNPSLINTNVRLVNIDSQFRNIILPYDQYDANSPASPTNYTIELTDQLTDVLILRVFSVQIPNTWYRFSTDQGNTCLNLEMNGTSYKFELPSGNYTYTQLQDALNNNAYWSGGVAPFTWTYNSINSKMEFSNPNDVTFYFYDIEGKYACNLGCINVTTLNNNLGWSLGFRAPLVDGVSSSMYPAVSAPIKNAPPAIVDVFGPKYFTIIIDDFNSNRQNKGLVNITNPNTDLNLPEYVSYDLSYVCINDVPQVVPNFPRKITQAQAYTITQIIQNRKTGRTRNYGTTNSDTMALLPLDIAVSSQDKPFTVYGSNVALNERRYFGPVNISKLKIRLMDDKGNTVNLNGANWCMSLQVTELYQY